MKLLVLTTLLAFAGLSFGQQTNITMSPANTGQTINTCNGFLIDSGGQGGPGYSNNETVVITLCPGTVGNIISVVFNLFQLSTVDDNPLPNVTNVDYMDVYDGSSTAAPTLGTYSGNQLQGVVISATALNPTGCITLRFRSNTVGTGMFTAQVTCTTPCATPTAGGVIVGGETLDSTRVCVGETVNFSSLGSFAAPGFTIANYSWDFMDGTTATGQNASHAFSTPGQYLVELFVTDNNGCNNTNLIDLQVFVATEPDFTGFPGDTTLCLGEAVVFNTDPESYEVTWNGFLSNQTITDGCLPDTLLGISQNINIFQTGFSPGQTVQQVSDIQGFCLDIEHSFVGDLVILVECPNGQNQILYQQGGGGVELGEPNPLDNVDCSDATTQGVPYTYCFTPTATDTWVNWINNNGFAQTLPAGNYAPIQSFNNLIGCPLNGVWTLTVIDNWAADDGTLFAFDINLNPALYPPVTVFEPQIGHLSDSSYWTMPANFAVMSSDGNTLTVTPTAAGTNTYVYNVIDNYGCLHDTSVTVTVNANAIPDAGPDVVSCNGQPVQLNGSVGGGSLNCDYTLNLNDDFGDGWNGNNLLVTVNGVQTVYTLNAGSNGTFTFSVPHGAAITVQFDNSTGFFDNECSYELLDPNGNTVLQDGGNFTAPSTTLQNLTGDCFGGLVFAWTPANVVSDPTVLNPIGTFTGSGTLTLSVYPAGHPLCVESDNLNYSVSASAFPGIDSAVTVCSQGAPIDLFPYLGTGASPNGVWTNPAGTVITMPYDPITMNPGVYKYEVDSNGCTSSAYITVTEISTTLAVVAHDATCHGLPTGSVDITVGNAATYSLNGGTQQPITASPFTLTNLLAGNYTLDVQEPSGCNASTTFTINEPPALQITNITADVTVCPGDQTSLQATGTGGSSAYTYTWINTTTSALVGTGNPINVTTASTSQYCVVLSEACGSTPDTSCMLITTQPPLILDFVPDLTQGCEPVTVTISNQTSGGVVASTLYNYGDGTSETVLGQNSANHTFVNPGLYTVSVVVTSDIGCVFTQTYTNLIEVFPIPVAAFSINPNPVSMFNTQVHLFNNSSSDVTNYQWTIDQGTPAIANSEDLLTSLPEGVAGNYGVSLIVTNAGGCVDSIHQVIQVISDVILYAPNTFTPDGDEFNQNWRIFIDGIDRAQFSLFIFNRWGEMIWENHDPDGSWDGTYAGQLVPEGQYIWTIEAKDLVNDKKYSFNGHLNVLK